jgi:hypothetical protein
MRRGRGELVRRRAALARNPIAHLIGRLVFLRAVSSRSEPRAARSPALFLLLAVALTLLVPLAWRAVVSAWGPPQSDLPASYLPALEARRDRKPFDAGHIEGLEHMQPGFVILGDSMAGRIDPARLTHLSDKFVAPILRNATGSAFWYLAFKNYVAASKISPDWVIVFFRDTNLTDPLWRSTDFWRENLDYAALDSEPELNAIMAARTRGAWYRLHDGVDRAYGLDAARTWLEPAMTARLSGLIVGDTVRPTFLDEVNAAFAFEHLRPLNEADMAAAEDRDADFHALVDTSVLPPMTALARERGMRLAFVRVLRRTIGGQPRPESDTLRRYVADMRAWLEARGAVLLDDRDDPAFATIAYDDGDHIARSDRVRYTELFWERLSRLPPPSR